MELRCPNGIKFGELSKEFVEVKCRSRRCGARPGVVVLHRFSVATGNLLQTRRFRDPAFEDKEEADACRYKPAIRSA